MTSFDVQPRGPFSLAAAADFAGGFAPGLGGGSAGAGANGPSILMAFPLEDWSTSAAVDIHQSEDGTVHGEVFGARTLTPDEVDRARTQAMRSLSLDHDGTGWLKVGRRDPVIAELQRSYRLAPAGLLLLRLRGGHVARHRAAHLHAPGRQGQALARRRARRPHRAGSGRTVSAFPRPQRLLEATAVKGISAEKVKRIHGLARAALDGELDTGALRELPVDEALTRLEALPGVGPWTAQGILMRGCGVRTRSPRRTPSAARPCATSTAWRPPADDQWLEISEKWRPFRMWATVLLHMAWRREQPGTPSYRQSGWPRRNAKRA